MLHSSRTKAIVVACVITAVMSSDTAAQNEGVQVAYATQTVAEPANEPFILLKNQRVLRGTPTRIGNDIVIRRQDGSELRIATRDVIGWASTKEKLFQFRTQYRERQRPGIGDTVSAKLADAAWCMEHELLGLVVAQLKEIRAIDPNNRSAARIQRQLYNVVVAKRSKRTKTKNAAKTPQPSSVVQASFANSIVTKDADPPDPDTLKGFVRHVQPILFNRCGGCHNQVSDLDFKISLPAYGARPTARMSLANLAQVSRFISFAAPLESKLRLRAMDGHSGPKHALNVNGGLATKSFDEWLRNAKPAGSPLSLAKQSYEPAFPTKGSPAKSDLGITSENTTDAPAQTEAADDADSAPVKRLPKVSNPFDPEIFNRRMQAKQESQK